MIHKINAFYINLDKSTDRKKRFQYNYGFNKGISRFPAVCAKNYYSKIMESKVSLLTQARIELNRRHSHEEIDKIGAIGCSLSHFYLWTHILNDNKKNEYSMFSTKENVELVNEIFKNPLPDNDDDIYLILEDDVDIEPYKDVLADIIQKQYTELNNYRDWDIWFLGCIQKELINHPLKFELDDYEPQFSDTTLNVSNIGSKCVNTFCRVLNFFQTHAYIVKRSTLKRLVNELPFFPIESHIDAWFGLLSQQNKLKVICNKKKLLMQKSKSVIEHGKKFKLYHFVTRYFWIIIIFILVLLYSTYYLYKKKSNCQISIVNR